MLPGFILRSAAPAAVLVVLAIVLLPADARAAPKKPTAGALAAARPILKTAQGHYKAKRYTEAAHLYHAAYQLSGNPIDLFNAARAEQRGFQLDAAEADYKRYLKVAPAGQAGIRRAKVHLQEVAEARAALSSKAAGGGSDKSSADGAGAAIARKKAAAGWKTPAAWGALGLGALGVGLGGWWLVSASMDSSDLDDKLDATKAGKMVITLDAAQDESDRINDALLRGYVVVGVGVVAAGIGAWLLMQGDQDDKVALTPGPVPAGVGVTMRF